MFLHTRQLAAKIRCCRLSARAAILCKRDAFLSGGHVQAFARSVERYVSSAFMQQSRIWRRYDLRGIFAEVLGCLSLESFEATIWANFFCTIVMSRLTKQRLDAKALGHLWLDASRLDRSTNLAWFSANSPAVLLLSSPWSARPLGRPLPNINDMCVCSSPGRSPSRRHWKVTHTAQDGMQLRSISISVECSNCKRSWRLCTDRSIGRIHQVGERFMVEMPLSIWKLLFLSSFYYIIRFFTLIHCIPLLWVISNLDVLLFCIAIQMYNGFNILSYRATWTRAWRLRAMRTSGIAFSKSSQFTKTNSW